MNDIYTNHYGVCVCVYILYIKVMRKKREEGLSERDGCEGMQVKPESGKYHLSGNEQEN